MKTKLATLMSLGVGICAALVLAQTTTAQDANVRKLYNQPVLAAPAAEPAAESGAPAETADILPLVQFEEAPLVDVIKTLGRQANLNVIFDPKVTAPGPDGKPLYPPVSIRLENVTAQNVLEAVLNNNDLRLERDAKTRISRVSVKGAGVQEPLTTKVYQLKYTNPSNLVAIIKPAMRDPRSQPIPDGRTSQLIVLATDKEISEIDTLIQKLDTATRQVLIEARLLETLRNPQTIKGINWAGTFEAQQITAGNSPFGNYTPATGTTPAKWESGNQPANPPLTPGGTPSLMAFLKSTYIMPTAFLNADGAHAVFSFFNQDSQSETLATPRAVTADNMPATLAVTRAVPIFKVTTGGTQTGPTVDITYTNLGTILEVTPRISANSNIALKVVPEVSDIEGVDRQVVNGQVTTANIFKIRRITTQVLIPSGNTLVLGGLLSDKSEKSSTKVPILGDLPGFKYLFGSHSKSRTKANLLIFVTPTLVNDEDFQPTQTDFLKTKLPTEAAPGDVGSFDKPWDGTEPYDWSKPVY